ncbi:FimV/HubP family polar landmark protein [Caballeronia sp. DA-9]|uniref:FimV/HubP family polar landmark protein n=1 Tax=Caballeronia sp. DA-9 TaxID=3436237 RepID=UPI003F672B77
MIVRPSRPLRSQPRHASRVRRTVLIAASVASVLLGTSVSFDAMAQASAASATVAASDAGAVTQYSVKPGQSLSDIATQITGSTDRATREKMARALFDANPNAFMGHDPSRLKLGSVLNVPQTDGAASAAEASAPDGAASGTAASVASVASAPTVGASAPEIAAAPAEAASNVTGGTISGAATASSDASAAAPVSDAQPTASGSESTPASTPAVASAPAAPPVVPASTVSPSAAPANGPIVWIIGVIVAIGLLLMAMRAGKRRRVAAAPADEPVTPDTPVVSPPPETPRTLAHEAPSHSATGAADLEGTAVQRGQGELNVVAGSMENYDAAQVFDSPTEDMPLTPNEADLDDADAARVTLSTAALPPEPEAKRAPFMPDAPAALHRDFTPPRPGAVEAALAAERAAAEHAAALEQATREAIAREAAVREAEAREAAAREAAAHEAERVEAEAREAAVREAEAQEAEAREAAAQEATIQPTDHATDSDSSYDDEPSSAASGLPQPKFPQEAIEALSALDFGLPPRREAPLETDHPAAAEPPQIDPATIIPQPIADPAVFDRQNEQHRHPDAPAGPSAESAAGKIETGTAGAASVAGLGASRFGPLSLDFDYDSPASQTEPLPAFTPEQIATIARNKLELAVEYIELGDLSGARTLLQEVIESNDPATRQPAATLLSTLAPLS